MWLPVWRKSRLRLQRPLNPAGPATPDLVAAAHRTSTALRGNSRHQPDQNQINSWLVQSERGPTCSLMLDRMMRRVILLSDAELRSLSNFLFMRYRLNAAWIVLAARRDTNWPPYFLSNISTYQMDQSEEMQQNVLHPQGITGARSRSGTFLSWRSVESS